MQNGENLIKLAGASSGKPKFPPGKKKKRNRTRNRQAYMHIENLLTSAKSAVVNIVPSVAPSQGTSQSVVNSATVQKQSNTPGVAASKQPTTTQSQPSNTAVISTSSSSQSQTSATPAKNQSQTPAGAKGPTNKKQAINEPPRWLTPQKLLQFQQFQRNLEWNFEANDKSSTSENNKAKNINPYSQPSGNKNNKPQVKNPQSDNNKPKVVNSAAKTDSKNNSETKTKDMAEIKWELNKVDDDLEDSTETSPVKPQNPIVQGFASQIKFTVKDQKKLIATKEPVLQSKRDTKPVVVKSQQRLGAHVYEFHYKTNDKLQGPMPLHRSTPAGIPKSFLVHQHSFGAIEPQSNPVQIPKVNETQSKPAFPSGQIPVQLNYTTNSNTEMKQQQSQYSPTEVYDPANADNEEAEGSESPDLASGGQKRLSAFHRLGPVSQPKKPKLTINLLCNKDVREVVDDTQKVDEYTPVHLRQNILKSSDETVVKYLPLWPWKKNVPFKKSVTARSSKSVMILEQEQMEEAYEKDGVFFQVSVKDYPATWNKENLLDLLLDNVRGKTFIPCFIEFTPQLCKFLVIRSKSALTAIHKLGFYIRQENMEIGITISHTDLSVKQIDFIPRLVLRKILSKRYDSEMKLDLKAFTLDEDISHFIYFPLSRQTNQSELTQLQSTVAWEYLTDLNLSHNRLKSIDGFNLETRCPRLKYLDLSHNCLERVTLILRCRELPLKSLRLEGNPLCHDYTDPDNYVRVVKMMFPGLAEIDGLPIHLKGDLPKIRRHYCPESAQELVEQFLEIFFPLLDSEEERGNIENLYAEKAVMTITYRYSSRSYMYRHFRNMTLRSRCFEEGELEYVEGAASIAKLISKWPLIVHDPFTFTSDVLHHSDYATIIRVGGILKLTSDSLAQEEPLLAFTRTFVLTTRNGVEYKIQNEMVYWDEPTTQCENMAFQINVARPKKLNLKFESPPDKETKERLTDIFSKITELDKETSERCLEVKEWHLKSALEHFMKLVKLDCLDSLKKIDKPTE